MQKRCSRNARFLAVAFPENIENPPPAMRGRHRMVSIARWPTPNLKGHIGGTRVKSSYSQAQGRSDLGRNPLRLSSRLTDVLVAFCVSRINRAVDICILRCRNVCVRYVMPPSATGIPAKFQTTVSLAKSTNARAGRGSECMSRKIDKWIRIRSRWIIMYIYLCCMIRDKNRCSFHQCYCHRIMKRIMHP